MEILTGGNSFKFVIPVKPVPKSRPRVGRYGSVYTPPKTRDFENKLKKFFISEWGNRLPLVSDLGIELVFHVERPKSSKRKRPSVKPDIDNFIKSVLDPMNGIVFADDGQICKIVAEKIYSDKSQIEVILVFLP